MYQHEYFVYGHRPFRFLKIERKAAIKSLSLNYYAYDNFCVINIKYVIYQVQDYDSVLFITIQPNYISEG
jgi:hypothetical protein